MAIVEAAKQIKTELCARAAKLWELKGDQVEFSKGYVKAIGAASEKFKPMSIADFAKIAGKTGGPIGGEGPIHFPGGRPRPRPPPRGLPGAPAARPRDDIRFTLAPAPGDAPPPPLSPGQWP